MHHNEVVYDNMQNEALFFIGNIDDIKTMMKKN